MTTTSASTVEKRCKCVYCHYRNQRVGTQQRHMKTRSWRKAVFFRLNEIAVSNCHIIFEEWHGDFVWSVAKDSLASELACLVKAIESPNEAPQRKHRKVTAEERLNPLLGHFPNKVKGVRGNCAVHNSCRKRCSTFCTSCEVFLCLGTCYKLFHTRKNIPHR